MEFFQKMWNPLGLPVPGMTPPGSLRYRARRAGDAAVHAVSAERNEPVRELDPDEVEKKINEFKAVETWLNMQVGMLQMTIKTMEMQKASLEALRTQAQN